MPEAHSDKLWQFQSTPLREGRPTAVCELLFFLAFQSTPLREGRLGVFGTKDAARNFNPRPSVRGDLTTMI